jgi:predicted ATPase
VRVLPLSLLIGGILAALRQIFHLSACPNLAGHLSHPPTNRDGAIDFHDLLDMRATRFRQAREREEVALASLSEQIGIEFEKDKMVSVYQSQIRDKEALIRRTEAERARLVSEGSEDRVARLQALAAAAEQVRSFIRRFNLRYQDLLTMQDEVTDRRNNKAPEALRAVQRQHTASGLTGTEWAPFLTDYIGEVDEVISERLKETRKHSKAWTGEPPAQPPDETISYLNEADDPARQPLAKLEAEIVRLQKQVSLDKATTDRYAALSSRLVQENELLTGLKQKLDDAQGARARVHTLQDERENAYRRVFNFVLAEQRVLSSLYTPIQDRLLKATGTLNKLSFSVTRTADVASWSIRGEEELIDLRRQGQFRGRGALQQLAEQHLKKAWESGDGEAVSAAMKGFRDAHQAALLDQARVAKTNPIEYRAWLKRFAQWLYSTEHVAINYSIEYDGVDIRKLSPGTRGIVLLLLYLALDDADDRPLIIDQPEENLDPQSIFDELVVLFTDAKARRQVIMVTHNANLVINTDADQIIVATVGPHTSDSLPPITYLSGGLERADIRKAVCNILEGGEPAFRERARRLRVRLER